MSKENKKKQEEEINFLKLTIDHYSKENNDLKNNIEDIKITLQSNKDMLQEYLMQISNKDSEVVKLTNLIEQLKQRLDNLKNSKNNNTKINENKTNIENSKDMSAIKNRNINNIKLFFKLHEEEPKKNERSISANVFKKKIISNNNEKIKLQRNERKKIFLSKELYFLENMVKILKRKFLRYINRKNKINNKEKIINKVYEEKKRIDDIFENGEDDDIILLMDNTNQIWELEPIPYLTEKDLNSYVYSYLKQITDDINKENKENDIDDKDFEISLNNSFFNVNEEELE